MIPFGTTKPHFAMWGLDHSGTLSIITEKAALDKATTNTIQFIDNPPQN